MALLVYRAAPHRSQNRRLALALTLGGAPSFFGVGVIYVVADFPSAFAAQQLNYATGLAFIPAYLWFLGTLDTPLVRPLRARHAGVVLLLVALGLQASRFLAPELYSPEMAARWYARWDADSSTAPLASAVFYAYAATLVFGFVVALHAHARAPPGSATRAQAKAYAIAFGLRDAVTILAFLGLLTLADRLPWLSALLLQSFAVAELLLIALLSYGILRTQLFDIDLKLKWTLRRGTLVSVFLGGFFVAFAVAEQYLQQYGALVGGIAVGMLLLALRPLERAADRFADAAMPRVTDTHEYRTVRKREVYRAAVESALEEGDITPKERGMLATLAEQLGVAPREMHDIERAVRTARSGGMAGAA